MCEHHSKTGSVSYTPHSSLQSQAPHPLPAPLQAEAHARLLQLPAFNKQLNQSNIQTRNSQKTSRKPHHDPDRVQRTVYVESVASSADEQVSCGAPGAALSASLKSSSSLRGGRFFLKCIPTNI